MVLNDEKLRSRMDIRVYVDCDEDTRFMCVLLGRVLVVTVLLRRRLARDTHPLKGRGRTVADVYNAWARNVKPNPHRFVEPTKRFAHMIIPYDVIDMFASLTPDCSHNGIFADPGHLLAVGEDPTTLLDAYVNRVASVHQAKMKCEIVVGATLLDSCSCSTSNKI